MTSQPLTPISPPKLSWSKAIELNWLPLPLVGFGSFIQGDPRGGLLIFGSTALGVTSLVLFPRLVAEKQSFTTPLRIVFYVLGGLFLVGSGVMSVLFPILHNRRYWSYRRLRDKRERQRRRRQLPTHRKRLEWKVSL